MNTQRIVGHTVQWEKLKLLQSKGQIPGTMLFFGPAGIGKKMVARRFIQSIFCREEDAPCLKCPSCIQIENNSFPDYLLLEPDDKGKIPIGDQKQREEGSVRWLIDRLSKTSLSGNYTVIINGIETISTAGQNALLKTIEEPKKGTHLILIASQKSLILETILSRCSEMQFYPLSADSLTEIMQTSDMQCDYSLISKIAGGSMEIAQLLCDETILEEIQKLCVYLSRSIAGGQVFNGDISSLQKKIGIKNLLLILNNIYREMLLSNIHAEKVDNFIEPFNILNSELIIRLIKIFLALSKGLRNNLNIKLALKGMLYSALDADEYGLPQFNLLY